MSSARRLAILSEIEARFVDSAFAVLLPASGHVWREASSGAAEFVDERLQSGRDHHLQIAVDLGVGDLKLTGDQVLRTYRRGIEAVHRHCAARYGKAFHQLARSQQHLVLGLLQWESSGSGPQHHGFLFPLLVQHAAEACFEISKAGPDRGRAA